MSDEAILSSKGEYTILRYDKYIVRLGNKRADNRFFVSFLGELRTC